MASTRQVFIDYAKGFGILAVIWGHTMQTGWSNSFVYAFHIPLFFFISGYLFNNGKYTSFLPFVKVRLKRLVLPYFIYSFIVYGAWAIANVYSGKATAQEYWYWLYEIFIAQGSGGFLLLYPLWFVPCLLLVEIMYYFLSKLPQWANVSLSFFLAALVASLLSGSVLPFDLRLAPWSIDSALLALPFYTMGNLMKEDGLGERLYMAKKKTLWLLWAATLVLTFGVALTQGKVSMGHADIGDNPAVFLLGACSGILSTLCFSQLLSRMKENRFLVWLQQFGRDSYDVMAVHVPIKCAIIAGVAVLFGNSVTAAGESFPQALITFVLTVPIVWLLVKGINRLKSSSEESANTWTHFFPLIGTIALVWPMMRLAVESQSYDSKFQILGTTLFLIGAILMYASSTLYHAVSHPVHKARLRIFDHISIYVMIAGSYSLICLSVVGGWMGWTLFIFLWACVLAGTIGKFVALGKHPRLSLALYLAMGWVALLILWPMWQHMPHEAFWWIVAEGVFYTIGAYFFHGDEEHAYWHAIWHVFIMLGATSHTIATWLILS